MEGHFIGWQDIRLSARYMYTIVSYFVYSLLVVLGIKIGVMNMLGKHSSAELLLCPIV